MFTSSLSSVKIKRVVTCLRCEGYKTLVDLSGTKVNCVYCDGFGSLAVLERKR